MAASTTLPARTALAQQRQLTAQCLLAILLLGLPLCQAYAAEFWNAPWRQQKYILPILRAGPNNQLRHLRFMLALGKQLNRTIILTGITKHYTDRGSRYSLPKPHAKLPQQADTDNQPPPQKKCFKEQSPYQIEFSEILDRQYLEKFTAVTTTEEMKAQGWDGVIDALVYPNDTLSLDKVVPYLGITTQAAKVQMYHDLAVFTTPNQLRCRPQAIQALAKKIEHFRVVVMMFLVIGNAEVVSLLGEGLDEPPAEADGRCWQDLFRANRRLKANAWLQGIGRQYIQQHVGNVPYVAMHVRPQADGCWRLWMQRNFAPEALSRKGTCWAGHDTLHTKVGPKALATMKRHNITQLVVLTHPHLQPVINDFLSAVNLTAHYIIPEHVAQIARCVDTSSTFLMLVEMQIAVQSTVFLGTASSSITETVLYERLANGITANEYLDRPFPSKPRPAAAAPQPTTVKPT